MENFTIEELKELLFLVKSVPMHEASTVELVLKWIKKLNEYVGKFTNK